MLRRHVVTETEVADLCQRIYKKHRDALDLIFEHLPDDALRLKDFIEGFIRSREELVLDTSSKAVVRFISKPLDLPIFRGGMGWTPSGRLLLFEVRNKNNKLRLQLWIGPGNEDVRQKIYDVAVSNKPLFRPTSKKLNMKWNQIYDRTVVQALDEVDLETAEADIRRVLEEFLANDLPIISEKLVAAGWETQRT
jgi:hypothetical protein